MLEGGEKRFKKFIEFLSKACLKTIWQIGFMLDTITMTNRLRQCKAQQDLVLNWEIQMLNLNTINDQ